MASKKTKGRFAVTVMMKCGWDDEKAKKELVRCLKRSFNGLNNKMSCISSAGYDWDLEDRNPIVIEAKPKNKQS